MVVPLKNRIDCRSGAYYCIKLEYTLLLQKIRNFKEVEVYQFSGGKCAVWLKLKCAEWKYIFE